MGVEESLLKERNIYELNKIDISKIDSSEVEIIVFNSINELTYLIYYDSLNNSFEVYDLNSFQKIISIRNALRKKHDSLIKKYDYINDKKREIIMASTNNEIIIFNVNTWEIIYNFESEFSYAYFFSPCLIKSEGNFFLLNFNINSNNIIISDLELNIKSSINGIECKDPNSLKCYIYYENNNIYIVCNCFTFVDVFDFNSKIKYKRYKNSNFEVKDSLVIKKEITKIIIGSSQIDIWDFHKYELLKTIKIENSIKRMCLCSIDNFIALLYKNNDYQNKIVLFQLSGDKLIPMFESKESLLYIKRISIKNFRNILIIGNYNTFLDETPKYIKFFKVDEINVNLN